MGCFLHLLAVVTSTVRNIHIQVLSRCFPFFGGLCLGGELLGPIAILCLTFWGTAKLFSAAMAPFFTFPPAGYQGYSSPHLHQHLHFFCCCCFMKALFGTLEINPLGYLHGALCHPHLVCQQAWPAPPSTLSRIWHSLHPGQALWSSPHHRG